VYSCASFSVIQTKISGTFEPVTSWQCKKGRPNSSPNGSQRLFKEVPDPPQKEFNLS